MKHVDDRPLVEAELRKRGLLDLFQGSPTTMAHAATKTENGYEIFLQQQGCADHDSNFVMWIQFGSDEGHLLCNLLLNIGKRSSAANARQVISSQIRELGLWPIPFEPLFYVEYTSQGRERRILTMQAESELGKEYLALFLSPKLAAQHGKQSKLSNWDVHRVDHDFLKTSLASRQCYFVGVITDLDLQGRITYDLYEADDILLCLPGEISKSEGRVVSMKFGLHRVDGFPFGRQEG